VTLFYFTLDVQTETAFDMKYSPKCRDVGCSPWDRALRWSQQISATHATCEDFI